MLGDARLHTIEGRVAWAVARAATRIRKLAAGIAELLAVGSDTRRAIDRHAELSRLSDAELKRRGMSRDRIHRCAFETLTRR